MWMGHFLASIVAEKIRFNVRIPNRDCRSPFIGQDNAYGLTPTVAVNIRSAKNGRSSQ